MSKMIYEEREVTLFCDIHGHFRKKEAFMYCCNVSDDKVLYDVRIKNAYLRVIPLLLHQRNNQFSLEHTHFRMEKYKEGSARIVMFWEFGILNSFTLENSFIKS